MAKEAYSVKNSKGVTYYLNQREGKNGAKLYYFSREVSENALADLPAGYVVMENSRTGLPMLKKG
jgi:YHS domain-containing protein